MRFRIVATVFISAALVGLGGAWLLTTPRPQFGPSDPFPRTDGNAERGRDVFNAADCASCHATPGQPDRLKLGGGLALASPFGTFRPPNISPDPVDGIGNWGVSDFANALVAGVSPEGRHYYPAFPYTSYTSMTAADINDLFAYLKTLPPVAGRAPPHHPSILFAVRRSVGLWKLLFFDPAKSGSNSDVATGGIERGRYIVEALSHCAECHSTRNIFGAIKSTARFAGGIDPQGTGFVPNITPVGIGGWTEDHIVGMLETGDTPSHGRVGSSMADVVRNTAMLSDKDRKAIAQYIKSLPARPTPEP
ncbi:c-type cytochrome [Pararhizobium sp. DWP1-1-3]|uniref:c-type cytochrome n=1 Tax=Pararhizobium sp. DWP1-1-3 TaxID=2804652 RepID=UPI003CEFEF04